MDLEGGFVFSNRARKRFGTLVLLDLVSQILVSQTAAAAPLLPTIPTLALSHVEEVWGFVALRTPISGQQTKQPLYAAS
mgnify:CR=1 FL=1